MLGKIGRPLSLVGTAIVVTPPCGTRPLAILRLHHPVPPERGDSHLGHQEGPFRTPRLALALLFHAGRDRHSGALDAELRSVTVEVVDRRPPRASDLAAPETEQC
ncbi:hypothetical protein [Gordonia sp. (in: high G+C Gram-positive bacteria)]|uniref:hypothetical protein n=1 Tax=Gordonia sp. (in: high G+C Gram-positive bacteria) TaxID=84139 RepID=UPI0035295D28